jgi:hypothetical protein
MGPAGATFDAGAGGYMTPPESAPSYLRTNDGNPSNHVGSLIVQVIGAATTSLLVFADGFESEFSDAWSSAQ